MGFSYFQCFLTYFPQHCNSFNFRRLFNREISILGVQAGIPYHGPVVLLFFATFQSHRLRVNHQEIPGIAEARPSATSGAVEHEAFALGATSHLRLTFPVVREAPGSQFFEIN